jgi:hypothetical protein
VGHVVPEEVAIEEVGVFAMDGRSLELVKLEEKLVLLLLELVEALGGPDPPKGRVKLEIENVLGVVEPEFKVTRPTPTATMIMIAITIMAKVEIARFLVCDLSECN